MEDNLNESFEHLLINSDNEDEICSDTSSISTSSSESESETNSALNDKDEDWRSNVHEPEKIIFEDEKQGLANSVLECKAPIDFFEWFMSDIWELLVEQTNIYGKQKSTSWIDTNKEELKKFFALCIKMGQVKLPLLRDYWNTSGELTETPIASKVMSRNRFENILANLHVADNDNSDKEDRLYKISPLINAFNNISGRFYRPGKSVCIDESLVPFRGRIIFKQYIPNKRHRYGIKLFKLCSSLGYTSNKGLCRQGKIKNR